MTNNSVMKCCVCDNKNIGEFIIINKNKYHLCCIEKLHQENKQLKERIRILTEHPFLSKLNELEGEQNENRSKNNG